MRKMLWKRRIATLLILCMVIMQIPAPVYAQNSASSKAAESVEIPEEYETLKLGSDETIVDLSETNEAEAATQTAADDEILESIKTYGSIPVVKKQAETEEEPAEEAPVIEAVTETKMAAADAEEEIVPEKADEVAGTMTIGKTQPVHIEIPNETISYAFTPEEAGDYILSTWVDGTEIQNWVSVVDENGLYASSSIRDTSSVKMSLTAGETYYVNAMAYEQGYFNVRVSKAETISGNSVSLNCAGEYKIDAGEKNAVLVNMKVEGNTDFYLNQAGSAAYMKLQDGSYQFYVLGEQKYLITKKDDSPASINISVTETQVPSVTMDQNTTCMEQPLSQSQDSMGMMPSYFKFTPSVAGTYAFGNVYEYANLSAAEWNEGTNNWNNIYYGSGKMRTALEAGETYLIAVSNFRTAKLVIEKIVEKSLVLGTESEETISTRFGYYKIPVDEAGIYELTLLGDHEEFSVKCSGSTAYILNNQFHTSLVYQKNNGICTMLVPAIEGDMELFFSTPNIDKAIGNVKLSLKKKEAAMAPDAENCAKKAVTLSGMDETWMSFTPTTTGKYVFCTEDKSDLYTNGQMRYINEDGMIFSGTSQSTSDNIHLCDELTAGTTYYYMLRPIYLNASEDIQVAVYPVTEVEYSGSGEVKTSIRKAVTYKMEVPKAGFYQINVNGADESYFIDMEDEDGESYLANAFVYKDIPRIFQFAKAGTYNIRVSKEVMSDSADEITFSCTSDAALQVLSGTDQATVDVNNTDGVWIEYTPQESGWYIFDVNQLGDSFRVALSIESEDGLEIVYQDYDKYFTTDSGVSYIYSLVAGRKCYYKVYPTYETTGTVSVKMNAVSSCVNAGETSIPEITPTDRLYVLKTNFTEKQYTKLSVGDSFYLKEVTEGQNNDYNYVYNNNIILFPAGEHEYLMYFPWMEDIGTIKFNAWQADETLGGQISVSGTGSSVSKWAKFVPEESGIYSLYRKGETVNVDDYYTELYYEGEKRLQYIDSYYDDYHFLTAGVSYFYWIEIEHWDDEDKEMQADFAFEKVEIQDEVFGMGTNTISMNNIWMSPAEVEEGKYLTLTPGDLDEYYSFRWVALYDTGNFEPVNGYGLEGIDNSLYFEDGFFDRYSNVADLYVIIKKRTYTEEPADTTFTLSETEVLSRQLTFGKAYEEPASAAIKEYTFTADREKTAIIIDELDNQIFDLYNITDPDDIYRVSDTYSSFTTEDGVWKAVYNYWTTPGDTYKVVVFDKNKYEIEINEMKTTTVYDYDEYEAYIASGGTINLVNSLTDDMREKLYNDTADYEYSYKAGKYIFMDSSAFKNPADIWWPSSVLCVNTIDNLYEWTYNDICEGVEYNYGYGRYYTRGLYSIGKSSESALSLVTATGKVPGDEILIHKREPVTVLIQTINLSGVNLMEVGQTAKLTAQTSTLNKYSPTKPGVAFSSSNPAIVSVDPQGNMTANAAGTAVITCTSLDGNAKATMTITVKQSIVNAESVTISGGTEVFVGDDLQLSAAIGTGGKGKPTVDGVTWASSNPAVATVDENGKVSAKAKGTVTITATSKDGYATSSVEITVKPVWATKVELNEKSILMKKGTTYKWLEVTFAPANTSEKDLEWSSSNTKVATVSAQGVIKAKAVGTTTITVKTSNGKEDQVKVKVTSSNIKVKKIVLPKKEEVLVGDVIRLEPEVEPVNATNNKVSYKSSDTAVATVTNAGVVTAKKAGKATITVTAKDGTGKKATCVITVKNPDKPKLSGAKSNKKKEVTLTWDKVENADGYIVYMATGKKGKYKVVATINDRETTSYTVKKLKSKKTYYFKVVSFVKAGKKKANSKDSAVKSVKVK